MTVIRLLGRPTVEHDGTAVAGPRGHKAWGLLAYLALAETPPSRQRLVSLLFDEADDPRRALRWNLAELRRALAGIVTVDDDPVVLQVAPGHQLDVDLVTRGGAGARDHGLDLASLGGELLEGMPFADSPGFEAWLAAERHRLAADGRTLVYESALHLLAAGQPTAAALLAARAVELDPLDADHHTVLVSALVRAGDAEGARQQAARCADLFRRELGVDPPPEVAHAARPVPAPAPARPVAGSPRPVALVPPCDDADADDADDRALSAGPGAARPLVASPGAVRSYLDAGRASVAAGAVATGLDQLERAGAAAEVVGDGQLVGAARLELASALIHSRGGRGAVVATLLHQALVQAEEAGDAATATAACRELGFLGVQLGHRQSAEHWLGRAEELCVDDHDRAKVLGVRGQSLTDAAAYPAALDLLGASLELSQRVGAQRQEGWALSMIGRVHVLRGEPALAVTVLDRALELIRSQRWTAFVPWPETFRAEAALALGDVATAADLLDHAWVLATETQDHCWIVVVAHGFARLTAAAGDADRALWWCETGLEPHPWYLWPRARLLDAGCEIARDHAPERARAWAGELDQTAAQSTMRELTARAHHHRGRLGDEHVLDVARAEAGDIDNPSLHRLVGARDAVA
jgi:DNA-binding SARP family transcriptional activator